MNPSRFRMLTAALDMAQCERDTMKLYELEKSVCHRDFNDSSRFCVKMLEHAGFSQVRRMAMKADGVSSALDCVMPQAWDRTGRAKLTLTDPDLPDAFRTLADTESQPLALVTWSGGTPPAGIAAELIDGSGFTAERDFRRAAGKFVLLDCNPGAYSDFARAGALGLACYVEADAELCPDDIRWMNGQGRFGWYHLKDDPRIPLFALRPAIGRWLKRLLAERRLHVHATAPVNIYDGAIYTVTGLIPGRSRREVALFAHLYEPFPADDANGAAGAAAIGRALTDLIRRNRLPPLEKGLRVVLSMERYGFAHYLAAPARRQRIQCALNLDSTGHLSYRRLGIPLVSRQSSYALPFFGELLLDELIQEFDPELRYVAAPGNLSDDTFGCDPLLGVPTNWLKSESPGCHHHTGALFHDVDWELTRRMLAINAAYAAILTGGPAEAAAYAMRIRHRAAAEYRREADRIAATVQHHESSPSKAYFQLRQFADYQRRRLLSLNRFVRKQLTGAATLRRIFVLPQNLPSAAVSAATSAAEITAARLVVARRNVPAPFSLGRIPAAERRKFPGPLPGLFEFSLFDGKRTLFDVARIAEYVLGRPCTPETLDSAMNYLRYLERYGYLTLSELR